MRPGPLLQRLRSDPASRNSAYMIGSQVSIAVLQGLLFILLASALGAHEFGRVASVIAITSVFLPFAGMGLGNVAIMRISRGQAHAAMSLGNGLAVTAVTGTLGVLVAMLIGEAFLHERGTWLLVLLFGISEILMTKVVDLAAHVFLGLERQGVTALFYNLLMVVRLVFAGALFWGFTTPTALHWAELHLAAGVLSAVVVLFYSVRLLGRPRTGYQTVRNDIGKGFLFSVVIAARSVHTDADKAVLARIASEATAGAYTAAFRLVYMACTPITAVLLSLQARIFRRGDQRGLEGSLTAVRRLVLIGGVYCMLLAVAIYAVAPAVPWLLGDSFDLSPDILRSMCLLPFLVIAQAAASDALNGADAQRRVSTLHTLTAGLSVVLNLLLVPGHGWQGAVMAAYASQGFLVAGLVLTILLGLQAQRKARAA
ncbi:lipopolysaccharide biosynthesis protein [Ramlibacter tataouinensis]